MRPLPLALLGVALVAAGAGVELWQRSDGGSRAAPATATERATPALAPSTVDPVHERAPRRRRARTSSRVSFERLTTTLRGDLAVALVAFDGGRTRRFGRDRAARAWSTIKVPIVAALMRELGGASALRPAQRRAAQAAIERSDNAAAATLFAALASATGGTEGASASVESLLADAGDRRTAVNRDPHPRFSSYGQTRWSAAASARFYAALGSGCLLPSDDSEIVLASMRAVAPEQRWGIATVDWPAGTRVALKGGWGPEPSGTYLVRQSGTIERGGRGYGVAIVARPTPGGDSFARGRELVTAAAGWLAWELDPRAVGAAGC